MCAPLPPPLHRRFSGQGNNLNLAVGVYLEVLQKAPGDPLAALCAGVALLRRTFKTVGTNRHQGVVLGLALVQDYFLARVAEHPSEAFYNLGRAFHYVRRTHQFLFSVSCA